MARPLVVHKFHRFQQIVHNSPARFKVVVAGRRWGKCLPADTMITMADGTYRSIADIQVGDMVLSLNTTTYKIEAKPVLQKVSNGVRETVRVVAAGREIVSTPNHPHLVNNAWVEAKDIRPGDLIAIANNLPFGTERMADHELDLLAIWLAEGKGHTISNGTPEILSICEKAAAAFGCSFTHRANYDYVIGYRGQGVRSPWLEYLRGLNLDGANSKTKFIPDCVFRLPKDQLARFLNLFFATDGCIDSDGRLEIQLANERLVQQLAELLKRFGITGTIRHKVHKAVSRRTGEPFQSWVWRTKRPESVIAFATEIGAIGKEVAVQRALQTALASRGNANDYLPISYDEFVKHLDCEVSDLGKYGGYNAVVARGLPTQVREGLNSWRKQSRDRVSAYRYDQLAPFSDGFYEPLREADLVWTEVQAVTPDRVQETFDLTIADNANFFANGFVTHNTAYSRIELIIAAMSKRRALVWYVAPTYAMARDIMWSSLIEALPPQYVAKKNETQLTVVLKNGSTIQCKGADKPDSLRGRGVDFIVLDEYQDFKPGVWDKVLFPTLIDKRGSALIIGTPKAYNHLYDLYQKGQSTKKEDRDWASWQFQTRTSPFIMEEEIEAARRNLDERSFRQEFEASFETMSGRVYYSFDRHVHVGDYPFDPSLPIIVGQDFNVDPMCSVILQWKPKLGELWAVDEIFLKHSNTVETVDELERRYWRLFPKNIYLYPDASGGNRSSARGESDLQIFRDRGITRIHDRRKNPLVSDRINAVNSMLRAADGSIRLRIDKSCRNLIESLEQVIYKEGSREIDKSQNNDHMADALGYPIEALFPVRRIPLLGASR